MALATSSLPVPVSPWMRTTELVRATLCNESQTFRSPRLEPMSSLRADESEGMTLIALVTMYLLQMAKYKSLPLRPGLDGQFHIDPCRKFRRGAALGEPRRVHHRLRGSRDGEFWSRARESCQ